MDKLDLHTNYTFKDYYQNKVILSFLDHPFSHNPKHVLVICTCQSFWLLTKHKSRGIEFPGGKVEPGETAEEAAIREVKEETGGIVSDLHYIGQYHVSGKKERIIKNVYFAKVQELLDQSTYFETDGPVLLEDLPNDIRDNELFSFIMKDDVLKHSLEFIKKNRLN